MTVGHPRFELLADWATAVGVRPEFDLLQFALDARTDQQLELYASVLDCLQALAPTLFRWEFDGTDTVGLTKLARAWIQRPASMKALPRRPLEHLPSAYEFQHEIESGALDPERDALYLLVQCRFPHGPDQESHHRLRAWALVKGLQLSLSGSLPDRLLTDLCRGLRLGAYEVSKLPWRQALMPLAANRLSYTSLTENLKVQKRAALAERGYGDTQIDAIVRTARLAGGATLPFPPLTGQDSARQPPPSIASFRSPATPTDKLEIAREVSLLFDAEPLTNFPQAGTDQAELDFVRVAVDEYAPPSIQTLHVRAAQMQLGAAARFLPWDWDRVTPPERHALDQLISKSLANHADQPSQLLAALTWLSLQLGMTLEHVLGLFIEPAARSLDEPPDRLISQSLDQVKVRPPRRDGHWRPDSQTEDLVHSAAKHLILTVDPRVAAVLRAARLARGGQARLLGQLWPHALKSAESAHREWVRQDHRTARLEPFVLRSHFGQATFEASKDHVLARLLPSSAKDALPASTLYVAYGITNVADGNSQWTCIPSSVAPLNVAGSRLEPTGDELLIDGFNRARSAIVRTGEEGDWIAFHNQTALYWDAALRAATGVRPVEGLWTSIAQFDWSLDFVYVDDKSSPLGNSARIVPVPQQLLDAFKRHYVDDHLPWMLGLLGLPRPKVGAPSQTDDTPLLFVVTQRRDQLVLEPIRNEDRRSIGIESPLPLNVFRHRLRTQLHRNPDVDLEVVDSMLGHSDGATHTHGDFSMRVWLDDAISIAPAIQDIFERLGVGLPPAASQFSKLFAVQVGTQAVSIVRTHDSAPAQGTARLRDKIEVLKVISAIIAIDEAEQTLVDDDTATDSDARPPKPSIRLLSSLGRLSSTQVGEISARLLMQSSGLPTRMGQLRYEYFLGLCDQVWDRFGKRVATRWRAPTRPLEASLIKSEAPGAVGRRDRALLALDQLFQVEPLRSKLGLAKALQLATLDLCLVSRITDQALLASLRDERDPWRVVRYDQRFHLEWNPALTLGNRPDDSFQRFAISQRAAWLLQHWIRGKTRRMDAWKSGATYVQPVLAALGPQNPHHGDPSDAAIAACCRVVEQTNLVELPGTIAGYLAGRVRSASLSWTDWVRLRTGRWVDAASATPDTEEIENDTQPGRFARLEDEPDAISQSNASKFQPVARQRDEDAVDSHTKAAFDLIQHVHRTIANLRESKGSSRHRQEISRRLAADIHARRGDISSAIYLLCLWAIDMLLRPGRRRKLATSSVVTYFGALSPRFRKVACDAEIHVMDEEELEIFYEQVLEAADTVEDLRTVYDGLRNFHRFAHGAASLADIDWSSLMVDSTEKLASPGYVDEAAYLEVLAHLSGEHSCPSVAPWQLQTVLLLAYRFGLRGGEIFNLNRADLVMDSAPIHVRVHRNRRRQRSSFTTLKTTVSRRVVPLLFELTPKEQSILHQLRDSAFAGLHAPHRVPLLGLLDDPEQPIVEARVRDLLNQSIKTVTGQSALSIHDLRHSFASRVWVLTQAHGLEPWARSIRGISREQVMTVLMGPSRLSVSRRSPWALARLLGHSHPVRALCSYVHSVSDAAAERVFDRMAPAQWRLGADDVECVRLDTLPNRHLQPLEPRNIVRPSPTPASGLLALMHLAAGRSHEATASFSNLPLDRVEALGSISTLLCANLAAQPRSGLLKHLVPRRPSAMREAAPSEPPVVRRRSASKEIPDRQLPTPSRTARLGTQGLTAFVAASAHARLRDGLLQLTPAQQAALGAIQTIEEADWLAMVDASRSISLWRRSHYQLFAILLSALVEDRSRIRLDYCDGTAPIRANGLTFEHPTLKLCRESGWIQNPYLIGEQVISDALGVTPTEVKSAPTVLIESTGQRIERRAVLTIARSSQGWIHDRIELLICALAVNSITNGGRQSD